MFRGVRRPQSPEMAVTGSSEPIPVYPPFISGLPVCSPEEVVKSQWRLISKIKDALGISPELWNQLFDPIFIRLAAHTHLLPASRAHHHKAAGGLFHHSLDVAYLTLLRTEKDDPFRSPLSRDTNKKMVDKRLAWRMSLICAGLLHDIGKPFTDIKVTDQDGQVQWEPYKESLFEWATNHSIDAYYIHWQEDRHRRHEAVNGILIPRILGTEVLTHISNIDQAILADMLASITVPGHESLTTRAVHSADNESTKSDLATVPYDPATQGTSVPLESYVLDAIRRLVDSEQWRLNTKGHPVWYLSEGLFIVWNKKTVNTIVSLLKNDGIPGIPRSPITIAEALIARNLAVPCVTDAGTYDTWEVAPDLLKASDGTPVALRMIMFKNPNLVYEAGVPVPPETGVVSGRITKKRVSTDATPPAPSTHPAQPNASDASQDEHGLAVPPKADPSETRQMSAPPLTAATETKKREKSAPQERPHTPSRKTTNNTLRPNHPDASAQKRPQQSAGGIGALLESIQTPIAGNASASGTKEESAVSNLIGEADESEKSRSELEQALGGTVIAEKLLTSEEFVLANVWTEKGNAYLRHPEALEAAGVGDVMAKTVNELFAKKVIRGETLTSSKKVHNINGTRALILSESVAKPLARIYNLPQAPQKMSGKATEQDGNLGTETPISAPKRAESKKGEVHRNTQNGGDSNPQRKKPKNRRGASKSPQPNKDKSNNEAAKTRVKSPQRKPKATISSIGKVDSDKPLTHAERKALRGEQIVDAYLQGKKKGEKVDIDKLLKLLREDMSAYYARKAINTHQRLIESGDGYVVG